MDEKQPIAIDICRKEKVPKSHPDGKILTTFEVQVSSVKEYKILMELDKVFESPQMETLLMGFLATGFTEGIKYAQSQK